MMKIYIYIFFNDVATFVNLFLPCWEKMSQSYCLVVLA